MMKRNQASQVFWSLTVSWVSCSGAALGSNKRIVCLGMTFLCEQNKVVLLCFTLQYFDSVALLITGCCVVQKTSNFYNLLYKDFKNKHMGIISWFVCRRNDEILVKN